MENSHLHLTIREVKVKLSSPRFWIGLLGVVCILTVAAPFDTAEEFNGVQRFFYWLGIAVSTYFVADFVLTMVLRRLQASGYSQLRARIIGSLISAVVVALLVLLINTVILGVDDFSWGNAWFLGVSCVFIALAVSTIFFVVSDSMQKAMVESSVKSGESGSESQIPVPEAPAPSFYQRLPQALGIDLISLQAQDHYVEAKTTQGSELILIRLSDAMKELGADHGLQVHRSWWVSYRHISEQKRLQNKPHLILSDGTAVPVSRTYSAAVKAALNEKEKIESRGKT